MHVFFVFFLLDCCSVENAISTAAQSLVELTQKTHRHRAGHLTLASHKTIWMDGVWSIMGHIKQYVAVRVCWCLCLVRRTAQNSPYERPERDLKSNCANRRRDSSTKCTVRPTHKTLLRATTLNTHNITHKYNTIRYTRTGETAPHTNQQQKKRCKMSNHICVRLEMPPRFRYDRSIAQGQKSII